MCTIWELLYLMQLIIFGKYNNFTNYSILSFTWKFEFQINGYHFRIDKANLRFAGLWAIKSYLHCFLLFEIRLVSVLFRYYYIYLIWYFLYYTIHFKIVLFAKEWSLKHTHFYLIVIKYQESSMIFTILKLLNFVYIFY